MLCAIFGWIWNCGSGKDKPQKPHKSFINVINIHVTIEKGMGLQGKILKVDNVFCYYLPFEKENILHLPPSQRCLLQNLVISGEDDQNLQGLSYDNSDDNTRQWAIWISLLLNWANYTSKICITDLFLCKAWKKKENH